MPSDIEYRRVSGFKALICLVVKVMVVSVGIQETTILTGGPFGKTGDFELRWSFRFLIAQPFIAGEQMLYSLWAIVKEALFDAAKDKVSDMTKEEAKQILEKLGVKVEELTDELVAKVEAYKATLDTDTRRTVRKFWVVVSIAAFALGVGVGYLF